MCASWRPLPALLYPNVPLAILHDFYILSSSFMYLNYGSDTLRDLIMVPQPSFARINGDNFDVEGYVDVFGASIYICIAF